MSRSAKKPKSPTPDTTHDPANAAASKASAPSAKSPTPDTTARRADLAAPRAAEMARDEANAALCRLRADRAAALKDFDARIAAQVGVVNRLAADVVRAYDAARAAG